MIVRLILFLVANFGALALGTFLMGNGVPSEWYASLNKAPWTPPGWVFGAAWTTIMLCFSVYMAYAWRSIPDRKRLVALFVLQWVLNVSWNPVFFAMHQVALGLVVIALLALLVGYFLMAWFPYLKAKALLILPYFVWLLIATSLNAYILLEN